MVRRISLTLALVMLAGLAVPTMAQDTTKQPSAAQQAQQQKMTDCNKEATAKNLKGDERKTFMSSCLSAKPAAASTTTKTAQQQKMTDCNKEATAKNLKGDERKSFMSTCLSGSTKK
jgi:psiF repeat